MIIGVGCDIVAINRVKDKMCNRILSSNELELYNSFTSSTRKNEFLAGRFAAKEAISKAITNFNIVFSAIDITYLNNKPHYELDGYIIHLSISHEREYACAYVLVESNV